MVISRARDFALIAVAIAGFLPSASAGIIDATYVFGDSLSDVGNDFIASGGTLPGPPYVNGQFSNGPVWVQGLAAGLGLAPLTASLAGGTDYAYGGAETGGTPVHTATVGDLTGASGQIAQFQSTHPTADPNALYAIWIGSNDVFSILAGATPSQYSADIAAAVANVDTAVGDLAGEGAKSFLLVTVPDVGLTPEAIAGGPASEAAASALAAAFDTALVNSVVTLSIADSLNLSVLNTYSLLDAIVANPAAHGFTNVTQPCLTGEVNYAGGTPCANPSQYLFWDTLHPTASGQMIIANAALAAETPEPAPLSLVAVGLLAVGLISRRPLSKS